MDRWRWLRRHLRAGGVRTFDAGCGNGGFSIFSAQIGNEVVAASFSVQEQESARRRAEILGVTGIDFRVIDLREIEDHRVALGLFDQIICMETIEHVSEDDKLVNSLTAMLKPGGQILLSAPYDRHRPLYTEEREPRGIEDGSHVRFEDGSSEPIDLIVWCTGYKVSFPFFDESFISAPDNDLPLYRRVFKPGIDNLFFIALLQPLGAIMPLAEAQGRWVASYLRGEYALPSQSAMEDDMRRERERMFKRYVASKRHTMQVDFDNYLYALGKELKAGAARVREQGFRLPVPARARAEKGAAAAEGAAAADGAALAV